MEIIRREQAAKRFDEDCYNPAAKPCQAVFYDWINI